MSTTPLTQTLCLIVCGAGPAPNAGVLVELARDAGWTVQVVATPSAVPFLDTAALQTLSKSPVRSDYTTRSAGQRTRNSAAAAVIVAPATYNTINKLALGINDTYALNVAAEAVGRKTRVVILPFVNTALAARSPFVEAVASLRTEGVRVIFGPGQWTPHPPGKGDQHIEHFPWQAALQAATRDNPALDGGPLR